MKKKPTQEACIALAQSLRQFYVDVTNEPRPFYIEAKDLQTLSQHLKTISLLEKHHARSEAAKRGWERRKSAQPSC